MIPKYNLDKIKFGTDEQTWERAVGLYENGRVTRFKEELNGFFGACFFIAALHIASFLVIIEMRGSFFLRGVLFIYEHRRPFEFNKTQYRRDFNGGGFEAAFRVGRKNKTLYRV